MCVCVCVCVCVILLGSWWKCAIDDCDRVNNFHDGSLLLLGGSCFLLWVSLSLSAGKGPCFIC